MEIILKIIGGILTAVVIGYFVNRAETQETNGSLCFGKFILLLSLCCLAFSIGMFWVWFFTNHGGQDIPIAFLVFGFGGGFVYLSLEYFFTKGSYNSKGIKFSSIWSGKKVYSWDELYCVEYNNFCYWYIFEFSDGVKIRISSYILGQKGLFKVIEDYEEKNM